MKFFIIYFISIQMFLLIFFKIYLYLPLSSLYLCIEPPALLRISAADSITLLDNRKRRKLDRRHTQMEKLEEGGLDGNLQTLDRRGA